MGPLFVLRPYAGSAGALRPMSQSAARRPEARRGAEIGTSTIETIHAFARCTER